MKKTNKLLFKWVVIFWDNFLVEQHEEDQQTTFFFKWACRKLKPLFKWACLKLQTMLRRSLSSTDKWSS